MSSRNGHHPHSFSSVGEVTSLLSDVGYLADRPLATTVYLQDQLGKPLLLEGPAGVGKTELAKALAAATGRRLLRLQCYEGQDETKALYEWDYGKQMLYTQILREKIGQVVADADDLPTAVAAIGQHDNVFFSERFLAERPLLRAVRSPEPVVLLIDEVDRADEALEAVLLELLAEYQVSVPELGTFTAEHLPYVVLTSNNTRDLSAALKRRCLHLSLDYPSAERELDIIRSKGTGLPDAVATHLVDVVRELRQQGMRKPPGISEALDWARTLAVLGASEPDTELLTDTISVVAKYDRDVERAMRVLRDSAELREQGGPGRTGNDRGAPVEGERRAPVPGVDPDEEGTGAALRAARDTPGRHGAGYHGENADGPAPRRPVSSSQGERSFAANHGRGKR
ncbi:MULTISPECIES: AAA family ATPase [Prauserella salsuginis group]|uniref:AAA family ATPase n=1 Tax=Prauserella salsuginis TaxID=387889 RepID=A0ABW6G9A0_9PSEU|nr:MULTISPECIES: MoxR family ATPase [Prauserella salsuginis group]MCR3721508.1 MoxR-like ATPase [Prauserella flava]MCR3734200.1 MoxR-like ATPase [Prauserella salsuginis]